MKAIIVILISTLMLSGCSIGTPFLFNPYKSDSETNIDTNECNFDCAKHAQIGSPRHIELFNMCMANKGYRYVNEGNISLIGNDLLKNHDYEAALGHYEKALYFRPKSVPLYNNIALCNLKLKNYDNAIVYYNKSLSVEPNDYFPVVGLALTYIGKNELDKGLQFIDKCLTIKPDYIGCNAAKGIYLYKSGKYNESIDILSHSLNKHKFEDGYYYRGLSYLNLKNKEKAVEDFKAGCDLRHDESCKEYKKHSRL